MAENKGETTKTLTGKLLIAMPEMTDPRFEKSVIFLCSHSQEGAMGLIVNHPTQDVVLGHVLEQLDLEAAEPLAQGKVYFGGPVETTRGFVLHTRDFQSDLQTMNVGAAFALTGTLDVLEDICKSRGPRSFMLMLGYAGWGEGQLESEIRQNGWLVCDATPDLVFDVANEDKWSKALETLGVSPLMLSADAGRA